MKEKFGPFKLIDDKGHGSNATVYRAQFKDQIVAIKIFDIERNSEDYEWIKRFFDREISIIKKLQHPNIIKILKAGIIDETPYISMQFMEGGSLDYKLKDVDFFSVTETLSVLKPIASAIDFAHSKGIIHRDIKLSNILSDLRGKMVLSDFGIARFIRPKVGTVDTTVSMGKVIPGTTDFMAAEVLEEKPESISSDIYSLGITVYLMLSGQLPSDGRTIFTRSRDRVKGDIIPLNARNPRISSTINDSVMTAIAVNPNDRFKSASEFAETLSLAAAGHRMTPRFYENKIKKENKEEVKKVKKNWLDYWRYVIIPLILGLLALLVKLIVGLKGK